MSKYTKTVETILDVKLHSGEEAYCLCPFHNDTNPSFAINEDTGLWICHGCGEKGNFAQLAERLGSETPTRSVSDVLNKIHQLRQPPEPPLRYADEYLSQFIDDQGYWKSRGLRPESIKKFQLGFDPITHFATIPIRDHKNLLMGVIRRATRNDQRPKYLYPSGFPKAEDLFASWLPHRGDVCLVEGALDAIALWEIGFPAFAIYGSHLSYQQANLLYRLGVKSVTVLTDNDIAGRRARDQIVSVLSGMLVKIPYWPDGVKDPLDLTPTERADLVLTAKPLWSKAQLGS